MMGRKGRARKAGKREPNGRPQRAHGQAADVRAVATAQPHRRWLPEDKRRDQRAASVLGRLFLAGVVTETQCEAGEKWAGLHRAYLQVLAAPVGPVSGAGRAIAERVEAEPESAFPSSEIDETEEERKDRVLRAFSAAVDTLAACGRDVSLEVDAVCLEDKDCYSLERLRAGLEALARFWRLGDYARAERRGPRDYVWRDGPVENLTSALPNQQDVPHRPK